MTVGWHQHRFVNLFFFEVFISKDKHWGWGRGAHTLAICHMENSELALYVVMFFQSTMMPPACRLHDTKTQHLLFQLASSFLKASRPLFGSAMMGVSLSAGKRKKFKDIKG